MMEITLDEIHKEDEFSKNFTEIEFLASGAFGKVIKAKNKQTGQEVAVKIFDNRISSRRLSFIKKEISILQQANHKNIVQFLGYIESNSKLYILMELIRGGTLRSLIQKIKTNKIKLSEVECSLIMKNLFQAVYYLHDRGIVHRDIKPENIMLESDDLSTLKLIDFGLSSQDYEDIKLYDLCGTLIYMAPELLKKNAYSKEIDLWSCGIVLYMLLKEGEHPIYTKALEKEEYIKKMKSFHLKSCNSYSKMAASLLTKLLEVNPSERFTARNALNHPWITRNIYGEIPLTIMETVRYSVLKKKFKEVIDIYNFSRMP